MEYPGPPPPQMADIGFEPQTRARSNTWPCPRPEDNNNTSHSPGGGGGGIPCQLGHPDGSEMGNIPGGLLLPKKSTSRRNAWGNLSYADLITQAISSSPEKRLTLSQIYDWMVTNVSYFKDKGDSNSSAGWKNSIRHNLSLHNRFVRVQNEGTGKSSWWMLNPDAKPGKAARRRATSMETSKYEKRRGRIRKKIEQMRNGTLVTDTSSPCSSLSEGLDAFPESPHVHHGFQLSPSEFRPRASSNASSCGGRLSPILGVNENNIDLHDNQVPPMSSWDYNNLYPGQPTPYGSSLSNSDRFGPEQLAGSLASTMKLSDGCFMPPPPNVPEYTGGFTLANFQSAQSTTANGSTGLNSSGASLDIGATTSGFRRMMLHDQQYYDFGPAGPNEKHHHHHHHLQPVSHSELDFNLDQFGQIECDVDEVLQTELSLGSELLTNDFNNFGSGNPSSLGTLHNGSLANVTNTTSSSLHHPTATTSYNSTPSVHHQQQTTVLGRQWVH